MSANHAIGAERNIQLIRICARYDHDAIGNSMPRMSQRMMQQRSAAPAVELFRGAKASGCTGSQYDCPDLGRRCRRRRQNQNAKTTTAANISGENQRATSLIRNASASLPLSAT